MRIFCQTENYYIIIVPNYSTYHNYIIAKANTKTKTDFVVPIRENNCRHRLASHQLHIPIINHIL